MVNWVPDKRSVIILKAETNIKLAADSSIAVLNGKKTEIDVPPIILNGRLMVPVRFAAENLGVNVSWDETTQTVTLEKPDTKAGVINALREFDNLFDGDTISNWVYDLYDPEEGGFCFSKSAVGNLKYGPTIEGTYDTISIMNFMGLRGPVKDLPEPILSRLMNFLNERQDEASGYFYDKQSLAEIFQWQHLFMNMLGKLPHIHTRHNVLKQHSKTAKTTVPQRLRELIFWVRSKKQWNG